MYSVLYLKWCDLRVLAVKRRCFLMIWGSLFQVTTSLKLWKPIIQLFLVWQAKAFIPHKMNQHQHVTPHSFFFSFLLKCFQFFLCSSFIFHLFPLIESRLSHCTSPKVNFHSASQHHFEINTNSNKYKIRIYRYIRLASLKMKKTKTDK